MEELHPREIEVLRTIVEDYIATAAPVGSRTVSKRCSLKLSPASMRNTMADLTEKGYLAQPHTSAGRMPTVSAFRFYLDTALKLHPLSDRNRRRIQADFSEPGLEINEMLRQASRILSSFSSQVSMVLAPGDFDVRWIEIDFTLIKPGLVLAVLVLEGGIVQNRVLEVEPTLSGNDLVKFGNYLNAFFKGMTLSEARSKVLNELESAEVRFKRLYSQALELAKLTVAASAERGVFLDGALNMINNAEFSTADKMRDILGVLEDRTRLLEILDKTLRTDDLKITLCQEEDLDELSDCGVITAPYGNEQQSLGVVSVIGPVRMDYGKIAPVVDYIAKTLSRALANRF